MKKSFLAAVMVLGLFSGPVPAQTGGERVQFLEDLYVEEGEELSEAVCIGCSIRIRGAVFGDAVAVFGSIHIDGGSVGGDAVSVLGREIELTSGAEVSGDCVAVGGQVQRHPRARIGGDVVSIPGLGWIFAGLLFGLALFLAVLIGVVVLVVVLVRKLAAS